MSDLDAKLVEVAAQYDDLNADLARPEVTADPNELRRLGRELARLEPTVAAFRTLQGFRDGYPGARFRDAATVTMTAHDGADEIGASIGGSPALEDSDASAAARPTTTRRISRSVPGPAAMRLRFRGGRSSESLRYGAATIATEVLSPTRPSRWDQGGDRPIRRTTVRIAGSSSGRLSPRAGIRDGIERPDHTSTGHG